MLSRTPTRIVRQYDAQLRSEQLQDATCNAVVQRLDKGRRRSSRVDLKLGVFFEEGDMSRLFSFVVELLFVLAVACAAGSVPALAQTAGTGALSGTVTDATGAVVVGVGVKVTSEATGEVRSVISAGNGN